jgi:metal-responsive CopG/Arc/MetJ family transcriptional regulator
MGQETKFRLGIDTELLRAVNRVVARRGIAVSAFVEEAMERILKEEADKENSHETRCPANEKSGPPQTGAATRSRVS